MVIAWEHYGEFHAEYNLRCRIIPNTHRYSKTNINHNPYSNPSPNSKFVVYISSWDDEITVNDINESIATEIRYFKMTLGTSHTNDFMSSVDAALQTHHLELMTFYAQTLTYLPTYYCQIPYQQVKTP